MERLNIGCYFNSDVRGKPTKSGVVGELSKYHNVVYIDITKPLIFSKPFDIIIHKLGKELNSDNEGEKKQGLALQNYMISHPEVFCVDAPLNVLPLFNRIMLHEMMDKFDVTFSDEKNNVWNVVNPPGIVIDPLSHSLTQNYLNCCSLKFPLVVKPEKSCGNVYSHSLTVVFNFEQLISAIQTHASLFSSSDPLSTSNSDSTKYNSSNTDKIDSSTYNVSSSNTSSILPPPSPPLPPPLPPLSTSPHRYTSLPVNPRRLLLQQLIPHTPLVHKTYAIIGEAYYHRASPSIPPSVLRKKELFEYQTQEGFTFDSPEDKECEKDLPPLSESLIKYLSNRLSALLNVSLFGCDLLRSSANPFVLHICDINYLPAYKGVAEAPNVLAVNIMRRYRMFCEERERKVSDVDKEKEERKKMEDGE